MGVACGSRWSDRVEAGILRVMKKPRVDWVRSVLVVALVVGCGKEAAVGEATGDAGVDAGCPYDPDAGVFLTRRGCPLTIDYAIR